MASKWQKKLDKTKMRGEEEEKLPWKEPVLSKPANNDLSKQWCVVYGMWSFDKNKLIRKRIILAQLTVEARLAQAQAIMDELKTVAGRGYLGAKPAELQERRVKPIQELTGEEVKIEPSLTFVKAAELFLTFTKKTLAPNTYKSYRTAVYALLTYLQRHKQSRMSLMAIEVEDVNEFLNELIVVEGLANRTRNNVKGACGTFYNYCSNLDKTKKLKKKGNPFEDQSVKLLPQVQNKHQSYSQLQQQQYREVCEELGQTYLLTFCRWMYYTLMRPHEELRRLRVRDVRTKLIYVTGNTAKTNEGEYVDIPLPLEQLIQAQKIRDYPGHYYVFSALGEPGPDMVGPKYFYRRHVKVMEKMNLVGSGHDMYSWKHTGAIALWTATKDIDLVRNQARHSDIKQTIEYLRDLGIRLADDDKIHKFPVF